MRAAARFATRWALLCVPLVLGCATPDRGPEAAPEATFGAPLSDAPPVDLAKLVAAPGEFEGKTVKVRGKVGAVCQRKGCWMTLSATPEGARVRVTFKDYGFFVPKDIAGRVVVAEGTFQVKTLPQAQAQHYADEETAAGRPVQPITGDQSELSLVATGVALLR